MTDINNCAAQDSGTLKVVGVQSVTPDSPTICGGSPTVTLTAIPVGDDNFPAGSPAWGNISYDPDCNGCIFSTNGTATATFTPAASYAGTATISVSCGTSSATTQIVVIGVVSLTNSPAGTDIGGGTNVYCVGNSGATITVSATLTSTNNLPSCYSLTKNGSPLEQALNTTVDQSTPGITTVIATAGTSAKTNVIVVLKLVMDNNLWWFNGADPGGGYNITGTLTAQGLSTGTFRWDITAGTDKVLLSKGGVDTATITATDDNTILVKTTGASSPPGNDVAVTLTYNGNIVYSYYFTVRKPGTPQLLTGYPKDFATSYGFKTKYGFNLVDQFGVVVPYEMPINESFGPVHNDVWNTWVAGTPNGINTLNKHFYDHYSPNPLTYLFYWPSPVNPTNSAAWNPIMWETQYYRAGSLTPGVGILIKQHTLQIYQGLAREL